MEEECQICFDSYTIEDQVIFDCTHTVCIHCYEKLIQYNSPCPFCRSIIDVPHTISIDTIPIDRIEHHFHNNSYCSYYCSQLRQNVIWTVMIIAVILYLVLHK